MEKQLITFGTALMFLTRIPVGRFCSPDAKVLSESSRYFPAVGAIVGCMLGLSMVLLLTFLPIPVAVFLTLALGIRITGAFHEDGLADVADSAGAFDTDKKLDIMRDSRVGTYGALALILLILGKFVLLTELLAIDLIICVVTLITAHILSRWSSVFLMATAPYARPEAANKVVAEGVTMTRLIEATLISILLMVPLWWLSSPAIFILLPVACLTAFVSVKRYTHVFGGITGDCLGATNQIVEIAILLSALVYLQ